MAAQKKESAGALPAEGEDDFGLFAREMTRLGLPEPVAEPGMEEELRAPGRTGASERKERPAPEPESDREVFLAALGQMEVTFVDEFPEEESRASAEPRRMRQVRQGKLKPEAQLDLHGLSRGEARHKVRHFLENAAYHGLRTVLIVTGRGKGSAAEPVLRGEMERFLDTEAGAWVAEWGRAPRQYGGEGALIVFVKGKKQE